jgi:acyl-CoA thioesterase FadM
VTVRLSVGRIGERSFRLEYDLFDESGEHLATAATVHVSVDPATGSSTPIGGRLRAVLEKYAPPAP